MRDVRPEEPRKAVPEQERNDAGDDADDLGDEVRRRGELDLASGEERRLEGRRGGHGEGEERHRKGEVGQLGRVEVPRKREARQVHPEAAERAEYGYRGEGLREVRGAVPVPPRQEIV